MFYIKTGQIYLDLTLMDQIQISEREIMGIFSLNAELKQSKLFIYLKKLK